MRTTGRFALTVTVLFAASLFFSYLATIDPYQTCTRPLLMKNANDPNGAATLTVGMTYSMHEPDTAMWVRPLSGADDQSYIITGNGGLPAKPGSCKDDSAEPRSGNPTCNKAVSDGYLWGFAGMAVALAVLLVVQYLVDDDKTWIVAVPIVLLIVVYFLLNLSLFIITESYYMGDTTHVKRDFAEFIQNRTDSVFAPETDHTFFYSNHQAICTPGPAQWWTFLSFVSALVAAIVYGVGMYTDFLAPFKFFMTKKGRNQAPKSDRPMGRLAGFVFIVGLVLSATLVGMGGTNKNYGSYRQKNIERTSKVVEHSNMKCYFDNRWDIAKHGVRAYMMGTAKNGTYTKTKLSELSTRLATAAYQYDMDVWDDLGGWAPAIEKYFKGHYVDDSNMGMTDKDGVAWITFAAALIPGKPTNDTFAVGATTISYVAEPFGVAFGDNYTYRVTLKCENGGSLINTCIGAAAAAVECMADGINCGDSTLGPLANDITANISMSTPGRDYFLKSALANMAPGPDGISPMECSAWNHDFDVDTTFKWKDCKSISEDMNGSDCMKSACQTRHFDFWFSFFAFLAVPGVTATLWAFNWTMGSDDGMAKLKATFIACIAYVPVLTLVALSGMQSAYRDAGNNECAAADLGYFFGALTDHAPEEHAVGAATAEWVKEEDRIKYLQAAFVLYMVATVGVLTMIWTSTGTGSEIGASMSDAEKQTGRFTRLTSGF